MQQQILDKIFQLRKERNWSEYRLSVETGIPQSTISSWYCKKSQPSVQSLNAICTACGITLSQFFQSDDDLNMQVTSGQKAIIDEILTLTPKQQTALVGLIRSMKDNDL